MVRHVFPYFLLFLLLSSLTDDLIASFTPDPADDIAAAADNEYVTEVGWDDSVGLRSPLPPFQETPHHPIGRTRRGLFLSPLPWTVSHRCRWSDPLYGLMSLQR
jgi:hypothetical protein